MIPIYDVLPSHRVPWTTLTLIAITTAVFGYEVTLELRGEHDLGLLLYEHGMVPAAFKWPAAVSALFLHAGWVHVLANLVALWIFGENVEHRLGRVRLALLYLGGGVAGNVVEATLNPGLFAPIVGGSGAIATVMGAYLVLFPGSKVLFLLPHVAALEVIEVPVVFFVVLWIFLQILSGIGRLADVAPAGGITLVSLAVGVGMGAAVAYAVRRTGRAYHW